ncbi:MAG TPA: PAS domain-containing sensor histidine kinase [Candidatus Saccharimonadales bacterium]|nr:PAS domain-containing sensor histidine kinase [Candidatus Saccharimonadales bacterium]
MDNATTEAYRQYVKENLERLNAIFEEAAVGNFSQNIEMPAEDDAFIGLYKGTQILLDVIREKIKNLETEIINKNLIQEGLYNQEQELRALVENSPDIIARFDKNLRHVYVNPTIARITGIPVRSFLGKTNQELGMPEKDLVKWNEGIQSVFETGKQKRFEFTITSPGGIVHYFQARLVPEHSRDRSIQYVLGVSHEITEIKKKNAEFERDRIRDEAILRNIGDGLIVTGNYGQIQIINSMGEELLHVKSSDILGKSLIDIITVEDDSGNVVSSKNRPMSQALASGKKTSAKYYYVRSDKTKFYAGITVTPFILDKQIVGTIQVFRDLSKEKEFDILKDEFISLASHELRTPMTAIKGFISMIMAGDYGPVNEQLKRPLYNISTSTERQIYLINDLLDVSRIQARRLIYYIGDFSLKQILQEVVSSLQPLAKQKEITLQLQIKEDIIIQADADKIKQILNNLIGNAIKFTTYGNIQVLYLAKDDFILVSIIDTGIGIAQENVEKLFGKFQQINETDMAKPPGTGLGLFLSRELARGMGGDLWLKQSELGKGSTFILSVPRAGTAHAKQIKERINEQAKSKEKNIM